MKQFIFFISLLATISFAGISMAEECDTAARGFMPRYWAENPEAWPLGQFYTADLVVGGLAYTVEEALVEMDWGGSYTPEKWLFHHTVAAKLNQERNVCIGYYMDLPATLAAADELLAEARALEFYGQRLSREDRNEATRLRRLLRVYNGTRPSNGNKSAADEIVSFEGIKALYR